MDFFRLSPALCIVLGAATAGSAQAAMDPTAAIQSALNFREQALVSVSGSEAEMRGASQTALNNLVRAGIAALRDSGHRRDANVAEQDWEQGFSTYLTADFGTLDLGDHNPLSKWLAGFYVKLEERLGSAMIHQGLIGDIYAMNYAIPVVFAPKGAWRTTETPNRDWVEYRKHFIPFANVVTYYGVNIACNAVLKKQGMGKQGKKLCGKVADKLRFVMGRRIAPKLSDFVFNKANGIKSHLDITDSDRVYLTAADLVREIEQEGGVL